jgi:predicted ester cyclase
MENSKELVKSFYTECLTVNTRTNPAELMDKLLADEFKSINAGETKNKQALIGQIGYFWKLVPDLKWTPQEILQEGNKVIVRSTFSGSPNGDFMGMTLDGTKSFETMSIDIHTVENGQIKSVHHIEEWSTAIAQLKSNN